jgi:Fe-S oxidoreductase
MKNCIFLLRHGTPRSIATGFDRASSLHKKIAYECSLCGLCTAICPEKLDPCRLFLEMRRRHVEDGHFDPIPYRTIIGYETRGSSLLFSWYGFPQGCDTIFFPGCTLPGTRPAVTLQMYQQLRRFIPSLGLVLDCCKKPSHDLGRTAYFQTVFGAMLDGLTGQGIRSVLTACPNCTKIFRQYGQGITVQTVYEIFHNHGIGRTLVNNTSSEVSVHDPCPLRDDLQVQTAVRGLISDLGHTIVEMKHNRKTTICCGEGGAVGFVDPQLSQGWRTLRQQEAETRKLVTYCTGCTSLLNRVTPTVHIVDLLFRPAAAFSNNLIVAQAPFTYINRILLKRKMKKIVQAKIQRTVTPR